MKKVILTIIALVILLSVILIDKFVITDDITIYVEIIKEDIKIEEELYIKEGSSFLIELNNVFEIEIENGFLYKIDFLECYDNKESYIAIYINEEYSNYGITNLKLNNNDKVSFIYKEV